MVFFNGKTSPESFIWTNEIRVTENGFEPDSVATLIGQEIVFQNETNREIWPASNFHPTHKLYSELDPHEVIEPGDTWSFVLDKEGLWYIHDHLKPSITGRIGVFKNKEDSEKDLKNNCSGLKSPELDYCVSIAIEEIISDKGIRGGIDFFVSTYKGMQECHQIAHRIGEISYDAYLSGDEIYFGPETALCGWGFWHGFSTRFAQTVGKDYEETKKFCEDIDKYGVSGVDSCFHGIGHWLGARST